MANPAGYYEPIIKIDGRPLPDELRVRFSDVRVEHSTNIPSQATIRMADVFEGITESSISLLKADIGSNVSVEVRSQGATSKLFDGIVLSIAWDQLPVGSGPVERELVVTAVDERHKLTHGTAIKTYLNQSYSDIISSLVRDAGLSVSVDSGGLLAEEHEYVMVTSNAFDWISEVVALAGRIWFDDAGTIKVADPVSAASVKVSLAELRRFSTEFHAGAGDKSATVQSDDPLTLRKLEGKSVKVKAGADTTFLSGAEKKADKSLGKEVIATGLVAQTVNEAKALANGLATKMRSDQVVANGQTLELNPNLKIGKAVEIEDSPAPVKGKYQLSTVTHVLTAKGSSTSFHAGGVARRGLVDLFDSPNGNSLPFGSVPVFGVVSGVEDPEKLGRVKVKFPSVSDTDESWWARVVSPGAGKSTGLQMLPHIGDVVLVVFERGDLRRPVVLGGSWVAKGDLPDGELTAKVTKGWALKTKEGAVVELRDSTAADPKDCIQLITRNAKAKLYLGEDKLSVIAEGIDVELKSKQGSIVIADNGDITINGNNITIKAKQKVNIESGTDFGAKGGTGAKVEAGTSLSLKGTAGATLESSAITAVKGSLVNIN